jgi:hypothetical protein
MKMWIDLVVDEYLGVGAEIVFDESLIEVGLDGCLEEPNPTIYVFVPMFGTTDSGESLSEILAPVFYHVVNDFNRVDFVTASAYRQQTNVAVSVVVEAGD